MYTNNNEIDNVKRIFIKDITELQVPNLYLNIHHYCLKETLLICS